VATFAEVQKMLTSPGGPFEVVAGEVGGIPMKVYKDRMSSLRELPAAAGLRGDDEHIVYGERRIGFREYVAGCNSVSRILARDHGVTRGDRVAVLSANSPQWCHSFWGTVDLGAILVGLNGWWKADEILYGLEARGPRFSWPIAAASSASPATSLRGDRQRRAVPSKPSS
jgi:long-chain acyl-CoA synthetase